MGNLLEEMVFLAGDRHPNLVLLFTTQSPRHYWLCCGLCSGLPHSLKQIHLFRENKTFKVLWRKEPFSAWSAASRGCSLKGKGATVLSWPWAGSDTSPQPSNRDKGSQTQIAHSLHEPWTSLPTTSLLDVSTLTKYHSLPIPGLVPHLPMPSFSVPARGHEAENASVFYCLLL